MGADAKAEPLDKEAIRIPKSVFGPEHSYTAGTLSDLADYIASTLAPRLKNETGIWELLIFDVVVIPDLHSQNMLELGLAIYGAYATSAPGNSKPYRNRSPIVLELLVDRRPAKVDNRPRLKETAAPTAPPLMVRGVVLGFTVLVDRLG